MITTRPAVSPRKATRQGSNERLAKKSRISLKGYKVAKRKKGFWSEEEDKALIKAKENNGRRWGKIAKEMYNIQLESSDGAPVERRSGKQVRERWINHFDSRLKKTIWSPEEKVDLLVLRCEGLSWSKIGKRLSRSENSAKNQWHNLTKPLSGDSQIPSESEVNPLGNSDDRFELRNKDARTLYLLSQPKS